MKHSRSSAEQEIRDAVVARFRSLWPDARIIHEMNVEHGSSRADVVAAQPERLWICEIKSERDKLVRIAGQIKDFAPCCHGMIVAAHEKWTKRGLVQTIEKAATKRLRRPAHTYHRTQPSLLEAATAECRRIDVWTYPEPDSLMWQVRREHVPWHHRMLLLLWSDELRFVASRHGISCSNRTPAYKLAPEMARLMTGLEIERAVCQMLRARSFAEADPEITIQPVEGTLS